MDRYGDFTWTAPAQLRQPSSDSQLWQAYSDTMVEIVASDGVMGTVALVHIPVRVSHRWGRCM